MEKGESCMKKILITILVGMLVLTGAAMAKGMDWIPSGNFMDPVAIASINSDDLAHLSVGQNISGIVSAGATINGTNGFVVNSKLDPVIKGSFMDNSMAAAAKAITVGTTGGVTFNGLKGLSTATNNVNLNVQGADLAKVDIDSCTNANLAISNTGTIDATAKANLDLDAIAVGMAPTS
ncbi:Uncharacterised protein [uncultured archaeon]|nr:Uncharacterised protein [uncultured archaeon]